jgi:hypothetical protein
LIRKARCFRKLIPKKPNCSAGYAIDLACCDHAVNLDLQQKYTERAKDLKKRLEDLKMNSSNMSTQTAPIRLRAMHEALA